MATAAEGLEGVSAAAGAEGAKGKKGGKLTLVLGLVVVLAAAAGAAWYLGILPHGAAKEAEQGEPHAGAAAAPEAEHGKATGKVGTVGSMRPLDPFLANLADENAARYLKLSLQVEFVDADPPAAFDARLPQIRDVILTLVTSKTFADIRTPEGKERLREDIIDRINHVLAKDAVKSVYFTEFIVQ
jgi:flagellar FliL protein